MKPFKESRLYSVKAWLLASFSRKIMAIFLICSAIIILLSSII